MQEYVTEVLIAQAASEIQQVDQIFAGAARMFRSPEPRVYSELRPAA